MEILCKNFRRCWCSSKKMKIPVLESKVSVLVLHQFYSSCESSQRLYLALYWDKSYKTWLLQYINHVITQKQKGKVLGCLPTSAFLWSLLARHDDFNDAHIKSSNWNMQESIMNLMKSTFKSNPLPMRRDFVSKYGNKNQLA